MNDRIVIRRLSVVARIGVTDLERSVSQRLEIDVVLEENFRGLGDDLARTADYAAVAIWLRERCACSEFRLLESLGEHLASGILGAFAPVVAVELEIRKFVLPEAEHAAVWLRRERG
jgi:dihydroneopterin aldolase